MTFTITPQPDNVPPRVRIDVNSDDSSKPFTALTIKRDGKSLREQPFVGSAAAVLFDYEAPFGVPVSYSAIGTTSLSPVTIYSTAWADLTGWSTVAGSPAVSGGKLASGTVSRSISWPAAGVLTVDSPLSATGPPVLTLGSAGSIFRTSFGSPSHAIQIGTERWDVTWAAGPMVLRWSSAGVSATVGGVTKAFATPWSMTVGTLTAKAEIPSFKITDQGTPVPFSATSSTTLAVTDAWLIHPSKPSLSCKIDSGPGAPGTRFIEASSGESKSSQAVSTVHRPVGRRRAVVISSGPRQADEWTLVLESDTIAAKNDLRALVDDQTPLLLRSSASVNRDLPDDWYSVGDVTVTRVEVPVITEASLMTLPLTPVDEPIVRVGALWTWGDVLTTYSTWQQVLDANDTWLDVLAGPQP